MGPTTAAPIPKNINAPNAANGNSGGGGGVVAAAVIGTLIAIAAVIGAIVGAICYLKGSKDVYVESYHNANNLASGNNDL